MCRTGNQVKMHNSHKRDNKIKIAPKINISRCLLLVCQILLHVFILMEPQSSNYAYERKNVQQMCMSKVAPVQMTLNCFPFAAAIFSKESTTLEKPWVRTVVPCRIKSCPSMAIVRRACNLKITSILAQAFLKLII